MIKLVSKLRSLPLSLIGVIALLLLAACGPRGVVREPLDAFSAEELYALGERQLAQRNEDDAAYVFSEIERLYPYSNLAKRGLIMQAYAHHLDRNYPESRSAAERYVTFYPTDEDAAYAQYLVALSWYDQIEQVGRDQGVTINALRELRKVIELYPQSEYVAPAQARFDLAFDRLAAKEMEVGRFYLKRGHYSAAIMRFRNVVESFQTTQQTPEALMRLVEAYLSLGLTNEAQTAGAILGYNFEDTSWYRDAYAQLTGRGLRPQVLGDNWLAAIYRQTIRGQWL